MESAARSVKFKGNHPSDTGVFLLGFKKTASCTIDQVKQEEGLVFTTQLTDIGDQMINISKTRTQIIFHFARDTLASIASELANPIKPMPQNQK